MIGITQKQYRKIILKNIEEAMGKSYFQMSVFFLYAPLYLIFMGLIYFASIPIVLYANYQDGKEGEEE